MIQKISLAVTLAVRFCNNFKVLSNDDTRRSRPTVWPFRWCLILSDLHLQLERIFEKSSEENLTPNFSRFDNLSLRNRRYISVEASLGPLSPWNSAFFFCHFISFNFAVRLVWAHGKDKYLYIWMYICNLWVHVGLFPIFFFFFFSYFVDAEKWQEAETWSQNFLFDCSGFFFFRGPETKNKTKKKKKKQTSESCPMRMVKKLPAKIFGIKQEFESNVFELSGTHLDRFQVVWFGEPFSPIWTTQHRTPFSQPKIFWQRESGDRREFHPRASSGGPSPTWFLFQDHQFGGGVELRLSGSGFWFSCMDCGGTNLFVFETQRLRLRILCGWQWIVSHSWTGASFASASVLTMAGLGVLTSGG